MVDNIIGNTKLPQQPRDCVELVNKINFDVVLRLIEDEEGRILISFFKHIEKKLFNGTILILLGGSTQSVKSINSDAAIWQRKTVLGTPPRMCSLTL